MQKEEQIEINIETEAGYTPIKGVDYFTDEEQQVFVSEIMSHIIVPENGKDADPVDYTKIESFIKEEVAKIPKPKDGTDGVSPTVDINSIVISVLELIPKQPDIVVDYKSIEKFCEEKIIHIERSRPRILNSGGPTTRLGEISDVSITNPTNAQVLKFNSTTGKWENGSAGSSSPLTTKGDLYGYSTTDARIPVGDDGEVLTADSSSPLGVSWQPPQTGGVFTYYWTPTASSVASQYKQLDTPYATLSTFTTLGATNGQLLRTYVTEPNNPGLSFIPAGTYKTHIHANVATISGKKDTYLRAEIWEVTSAGVDIVKLADVGPTTILTAVSAEYIIEYSTVQINLASTSSRIATKLYATISGTGGQPDITVSVGDGTDSNTTFPAVTVSVNNFVPYTGATKAVNLGSNSLSVQDEAYGAGWDGSLQVPTKNAVYDKIQAISGLAQTPTLLTTTGTINNQALATAFLVYSGTTAVTLTGLDSTGITDGQEIIILNNDTTSRSFTISHQSTSSTAANRFSLPNISNMTLRGGFALRVRYVASSSRWFAVAQTLSAVSPLIITGSAISMPAASAGSSGHLTQTDWVAFNAKPGFSYANQDVGAVSYYNSNPSAFPGQLAVDKDYFRYNPTIRGLGLGGITYAEINAPIHAKTLPHTTITDVPSAYISFSTETAAGTVISPTNCTQLQPLCQRVTSFTATENTGGSGYVSGDVVDYQIYTKDTSGYFSVVWATATVTIMNPTASVDLSWASQAQTNPIGGFQLIKQVNGGGYTQGLDVGTGTTYTDTNFTDTNITVTPFSPDFIANGSSRVYNFYGTAVSPSGGIYGNPTPFTFTFFDDGSGNAYNVSLTAYLNSPSTGVFVENGTNGYYTSSTNFSENSSTFNVGTTPPPEHYGILSDGSNLNWNINLYGRNVISGRAYYSVNPYNLTNTDTNTGQYLYATISLPYYSVTDSTKTLLSVNGGAFTSAISTTNAQYIDALNFPLSGDDVITPTSVYKPVQILEQYAESEDDPSALVIKGINGYQSITFQNLGGTQIAKIIVGTDGSVDFICSVLKVNGTPV